MNRKALIFLTLVMSGCATPPDPVAVATLHARVSEASDDDRSAAARVSSGLSAATLGVSLGCTIVNDLADIRAFDALRQACFDVPSADQSR